MGNRDRESNESMSVTQDNITYERPPVIELVLGVQFERIVGFNSCDFGVLRDAMSKLGYTSIEEQHPLEPSYETFGAQQFFLPQFGFARVEDFTPRIWFKTPDDAFIVQFQPSRLICNWRRNSETAEYPRFASLRERFEIAYKAVSNLLAKLEMPPMQCNQAEVSYINHIPNTATDNVWADPGRVASIFGPFPLAPNEHVEDSNFQIRYVIESDGKPAARLVVTGQPMLAPDQQRVFSLNFSVKGMPQGKDLPAVNSFLELGHRAIVNKFDQLATEHAKRLWGKLS